LDEEGVCRAAFDLTSAFDEAISLGNKENVTVAQVKQYCEMESHEEKLYKLVMQSKINETRDRMRQRVTEIEKSKVRPILFLKETCTSLGYSTSRDFLFTCLYTVKVEIL
jgi:hypothetical protein